MWARPRSCQDRLQRFQILVGMNAGPAQNTAGTSVLTFNPSCYRQDLETFFTGGKQYK